MSTISRRNEGLRDVSSAASSRGSMRSKDRRRALLPLAACSSLLACLPSAADAASAPIVTGSHGSVTLDQIAGGNSSFTSEHRIEARSYEFHFPPHAAQGPDIWYLIRLDVSIVFASGAESGSVLVSGFTDDQAAAQVEFYPGRDKRGRPVVRWDSIDLIRGSSAGRRHGEEARVHYVNYLQFKGVRPGSSTLTFQVERFGGARTSEVRIGPSSGVYATPAGPVELKLSADFPDEGVLAVGEPAQLEVDVANKSPRVAENVTVTVRPQSSHLFIDGLAQRTIERIDGAATTHFTIGRTRPGRLRVKVLAAAPNGSEALAVIESEVTDDGDGREFTQWIALAIGAIAITGGAALVRRRKVRGTK